MFAFLFYVVKFRCSRYLFEKTRRLGQVARVVLFYFRFIHLRYCRRLRLEEIISVPICVLKIKLGDHLVLNVRQIAIVPSRNCLH